MDKSESDPDSPIDLESLLDDHTAFLKSMHTPDPEPKPKDNSFDFQAIIADHITYMQREAKHNTKEPEGIPKLLVEQSAMAFLPRKAEARPPPPSSDEEAAELSDEAQKISFRKEMEDMSSDEDLETDIVEETNQELKRREDDADNRRIRTAIGKLMREDLNTEEHNRFTNELIKSSKKIAVEFVTKKYGDGEDMGEKIAEFKKKVDNIKLDNVNKFIMGVHVAINRVFKGDEYRNFAKEFNGHYKVFADTFLTEKHDKVYAENFMKKVHRIVSKEKDKSALSTPMLTSAYAVRRKKIQKSTSVAESQPQPSTTTVVVEAAVGVSIDLTASDD
jgi:hypothetical protein